ncbi:acetylxylan esterase [Compostimonas suwonensis]|uniref:Cephalosporin-C deacetylase n=1 Tax=Compostimonas suwonensis TaxID=1048394 RepID=A0A2M9BVG8_9MICO|nr:acetylxylan esterase [Compostimonas suwonensis]PJJ61894.1 cephalosporin-C deacetylase [Compostimonas suwonensis]
MNTDIPLPGLEVYRSSQLEPEDFLQFWASTVADSRTHDVDVVLERVDTGLETVDVYDVTFSGFGGHRIRGWLRIPAGANEPLPAVVEFAGYGGGRGHAIENLFWASSGFAHLHMDSRGQGSGWSLGATPDPVGSGPHAPGMWTQGIESPESYYYRRLYTDGVRAVDAARTLPAIDPRRVSVVGVSQGGGAAIAVGALAPEVQAVVALVPGPSDFPRSLALNDRYPWREVTDYLAVHRGSVAQVERTLAYFDAVNFARHATAPARFSVGLMDPVVLPSSVFGAYNAYTAPKGIAVWPYNGHEGGGPDDLLQARRFLLAL